MFVDWGTNKPHAALETHGKGFVDPAHQRGPDLTGQISRAKGLRWVERNIFEAIFCRPPNEIGFHTKKYAARRRRAFEYMHQPSPDKCWVPHSQDADAPRFPGDLPGRLQERKCPWLPHFSEDIHKRLFEESRSQTVSDVVDFDKHLPEDVKRRRVSNAVLRRQRSEKSARSESPKHKWRPIDDFGPVAPWLGPKGAEYLKIVEAEPHTFSEYPEPMDFHEADIVGDISKRSAYVYLDGNLHFGRTDGRPIAAGEAFLPTWVPDSAPIK